jgi:ParB-like chromosome segregation protein Spo0J
MVTQYETAKRAGRIDPAEAQRFNAMEARLRNLRDDLARDGISMQDCQRIGSAIAREHDEVSRMTRREPNVARCMTDNRRAHHAIYETYNNAVRAGRIDAGEAQQFRVAEERLRKFQAEIARDGVTPDECQRLSRALAQERALVDAMGRR